MEILKYIRWQDILDIIIVAFLVYRLLLFIKGTSAVQMLIGLGVLLFVSFLASNIQLYTIDWIIQTLWAHIAVALLVLFQPEIRRALVQMGKTASLRSFTSAEELKSLDEIVKAAVTLSNKKIGALIAIERDTVLGDFVEIGTLLEAKVTREILVSIFHPTSPIHDGAVVIKGNRIIAAGCFLPIILRPDIDKTMGTRHRAGIGLTEETDAIVIVVSEETGSISMASGGKFEVNLDMTALRNRLTEIFTGRKKGKR